MFSPELKNHDDEYGKIISNRLKKIMMMTTKLKSRFFSRNVVKKGNINEIRKIALNVIK